jgi:phenylacetate-CoA ligase
MVFLDTISSILPEIQWPPIPTPLSAQLMTLIKYLEKNQWLSADEIQKQQINQMKNVVSHAVATVPYYQQQLKFLKNPGNPQSLWEQWQDIPLLTRENLQLAGNDIYSNPPIKEHGTVSEGTTSGSTGRAVTVLHNDVTSFFNDVFILRDHLWHQRDFAATLGIIRFSLDDEAIPPFGKTYQNWGSATSSLTPTGPCIFLRVCTLAEEAEWLKQVNPDYLLCFPSTLKELIRYFNAHQIKLPRLREVRTFGEIVEPDLREDVKTHLNVKLTDIYSASEVGYIATQCPDYEHYHVQSENVFLEILNDQGHPCAPGEMGRVVLTALHNFASPLIRYDIGDYAIAGETCPCGRGLPVLSRILGRKRNLITYPDGTKKWPSFAYQDVYLKDIFKNSQYQLIQHTLDHIEVKVTCAANPPDIEAEIEKKIQKLFSHPFKVTFTYLTHIPRDASGKFEDFKSHLI